MTIEIDDNLISFGGVFVILFFIIGGVLVLFDYIKDKINQNKEHEQ